MVEDFDRNGNVRSSIPAQFLAVIWTPDENQIRNQQGESGIKRLMLDDETRLSLNLLNILLLLQYIDPYVAY